MKVFVLAILGLMIGASANAQKRAKAYPLVTVRTIKKSSSDTVRLKAYVMDIYVCPPCPEGMQCKPCIENNFTVVDDEPVNIFKIPLDQRLRVVTPHPDSLKYGKRYVLTIRLRNRKEAPSDNVELVSYKPL